MGEGEAVITSAQEQSASGPLCFIVTSLKPSPEHMYLPREGLSSRAERKPVRERVTMHPTGTGSPEHT